MSIRQFIKIRRRYLRSVNIVKDQKYAKNLDGYVITPLVQQALAQIAAGFSSNTADRAFTLTGPYGTGKSSFALFLCDLLRLPDGEAWKLLRTVNNKLAIELHEKVYSKNKKTSGFVVLPITARRAPVSVLLAEAFDEADEEIKDMFLGDIEALRNSSDSKTTVRLVEKIANTAVGNGFNGLFFVFDELGKVFEEAYYNKKNTDIFILQDLAEAASRSGKAPILFLGMLHQAFGNYVDDISDIKTKNEFSKIEGRFQPIAFIETPAAQIQLLANAFTGAPEIRTITKQKIDQLIKIALNDDVQLPNIAGLTAEQFYKCAHHTWPMHPLTMVALPLLFRRFGQNERSIFTYLSSNEPNGFQDFLDNSDESELLRLADLYDYLLTNHETQLSRHPQGKIFLEANDILHSKDLSKQDVEIVKTVTVLAALGKQSNLKASSGLIHYALSREFSEKELEKLSTQSILVYRKFSSSYSIWEGSDVDLIACGEKADRALGQSGFDLAEPLQTYLPPMPVIAKRHSFETGALRYFTVEYLDNPDDFEVTAKRKNKGSDAVGRIIICLSGSSAVSETFIELAKACSTEEKSTLFAVPQDIDELRAALREVQRLRWIIDNTQELRDDRIAEREVDLRLAEANQKVMQQQINLNDPRPAPRGCGCAWIWNGQNLPLKTTKDVSVLLSSVCDKLYHQSPKIWNEMICKRNISSQAAAARNSLIKYIIAPEQQGQEFLGITGFPPARSIYESLLKSSGLHRQTQGRWHLAVPDIGNEVKLHPCWKLLEERIFAATENPILLKDLYAELKAPPYGLLDGVLPILITVFFALNRDEVTLYQEGSFLPDPQDAHFELMVRRPDLFSIAGARITGMRKRIIERLSNGLDTDASVSQVVRYLYRMLKSLPKYAMTTNRVSEHLVAFRLAFNNATSPERLLFVDLPKIFGLSAIGEDQGNAEEFDQYFQKLNQSLGELSALLPNLLKEQRGILLSAFKLPDSQDGWNTLYERACFLAPKINNTELIPFIQNVANTIGDWNKADAVIGYMVSTPLANWGTIDINNFPGIAEGKAQLFMDAYRPYMKTVASLTKAEMKKAESLKMELMKQISVKSDNNAITRAALLACIEDLDKE